MYKCTPNQFCPPRWPRDLQRGPDDSGGCGQLRGDRVRGQGEAGGVHKHQVILASDWLMTLLIGYTHISSHVTWIRDVMQRQETAAAWGQWSPWTSCTTGCGGGQVTPASDWSICSALTSHWPILTSHWSDQAGPGVRGL